MSSIGRVNKLTGVVKDEAKISVEIIGAGPRGPEGSTGLSAYETWLEQGNVGSESDFLDSLKVTDANYVHDQISSAKEWRIIHSLGKYPSVSIVDTGGNMVVGEVHYVSINEVIISFSFEFSGKAYLN